MITYCDIKVSTVISHPKLWYHMTQGSRCALAQLNLKGRMVHSTWHLVLKADLRLRSWIGGSRFKAWVLYNNHATAHTSGLRGQHPANLNSRGKLMNYDLRPESVQSNPNLFMDVTVVVTVVWYHDHWHSLVCHIVGSRTMSYVLSDSLRSHGQHHDSTA